MVKRSLCVAALAVLVTVPVFAKVVANATRTNVFGGTGTFLMPLTDGGAVVLGFNGSGKHAISYSAECSGTGSWVSIQIIVDGVALAPTAGTDDAFCSDFDGNGIHSGWMTAHHRAVTGNLALGAHGVSVQVTAVGGSARVDDASLVVEK
jgi:hypothetical protein